MVTRIILIIALALAAASCGGAPTAAPGSERVRVIASFYPLAFAAEEVGGGRVDVTNLTPPGAEPHDVELSARDVTRIHSADVVFYLGGGFQPALERVLAGADVRAVDLLEGLELRTGEQDLHEGEARGGVDAHVWLDPVRYAAVVERIGVELGAEERAASLISQLESLHAEYERALADCTRREIVTPHPAFGYLAERYRLEELPIRGGLLPEAEVTSRQLEHAVEQVRSRDVTTIFVEPLRASDASQTVAREAGVATAVLDPVEGLAPSARDRGADYFSLMRDNLASLREALGCR